MGRARALGWLRVWTLTLDWVGWSSLCLSSPARGFKQTYTKPKRKRDATAGFTFSFSKKISVTTGNSILAEISRFFGNFDRKEFSNSKFRNFGIPAGFSVHLAGFSVLFTEK